jgi:hypothetical protein
VRKLLVYFLAIFFVTSGFLSGAEGIAGTYTTNFPLTENPISEGGNWINGRTTGLDWFNVMTDGVHAHGTTTTGSYTDPTAVLKGTWGPDQMVEATVYSNVKSSPYYPEVELRLRTTISAHSCTGYEILFSVDPDDRYIAIARWNGPVGNFSALASKSGSSYWAQNGDRVKATIVGSTITVYINDVQVLQATDSTYSGGSPGMGFNYGCNGTYSDFGFTNFTASDGSSSPALSAPSGLRVVE